MEYQYFIIKNQGLVEGRGFKQVMESDKVLVLNSEQRDQLTKEAFGCLWDQGRSEFSNLKDCCRYFNQVTKSNFCPPLSYFEELLGKSLEGIDYKGVWDRALFEERREQNKGRKIVRIKVGGVNFNFSPHSVERFYERFSVCEENCKMLLGQILRESSAVIPPKKLLRPDTVFLYHRDYHFALILKKTKNPRSFIVLTSYEPSLNWRRGEIDDSFRLPSEEEIKAA